MSSLDPFFNPKSIALIGAAHTEIKLGGVVLKNLLKFKGRVYPVNPKYPQMMGLTAYPSAAAIPEPVDLALILRPAEEVPGILREFKDRARCLIVMSSGFAEVGESVLQEEVRKTGKELGFRILGPNCMGLYNPHQRLDTFFLPYERLERPKKGNVAVVSQSGAILSCILSALYSSQAGISKAVGYGNAMDVDESDIYEYLADDRQTAVVVSYIESVGNGRKFVEKAKVLSAKKQLIVLKSGKGTSGQSAAYSHTGRLAGRYEVFHSVLRQFGIREAVDFDDLADASKALSYQKPSLGMRILIITNGGGSGVLAADESMRQGLDVMPLPEGKKARLIRVFPNFFGINNPLDLTAQVKDGDYVAALTELKDDYDGFLIIALPNVLGISAALPELLKHFKDTFQKPLVCNLGPGGISKRLSLLIERTGIPTYPTPERAVRALKALLGNALPS